MSGVREGIYLHHEGGLYRVIGLAVQTDTREELVIYQDAVNGGETLATPLAKWDHGEAGAGGAAQPPIAYLAPSLEALDEKPMFSLIEAVKDHMQECQFDILNKVLRFYHKPTGRIAEVEQELLSLLEDGGETDGHDPEDVAEALFVLEHWSDFLALPDEGVNEYDQMEAFIGELPVSCRDSIARTARGKGAFRRFKDAAEQFGVLDRWYRYLDAAYRREAREWCDANGIAWWKDRIS